jgi:hypothetical protein
LAALAVWLMGIETKGLALEVRVSKNVSDGMAMLRAVDEAP